MCFLRIVLKLRSGIVKTLLFSRASRSARVDFEFSIAMLSLDILLLQCLSSYLSILNLRQSTVAALEELTGRFQTSETSSINPRCCTQKDSNLNRLLFGIEVSIVTTQGMWSEIGFPRGFTMVFGYDRVQLVGVRNQSSCSSRGPYCILLQVYALPLIGSSMSPCDGIKSLNVIISLMLPPGLLRLVGLQM